MTEHVRADADAIVIRGEDGIRASEVVVGAATDVGRLRTINEDGYLAIAPAFVVVDGMGGHAAGRMATQVALDSLYSLAGATITDVDTVVRAVVAAQEAIIAIPSHAAYLPGATIAGVILTWIPDEQGVTRPTWVIFNIGDARVYLLRGDMLSQVTRDHSRVQILIETGELTPEQARRDSRRNIVTRALGGGIADSGVPDLYSVPVAAGDRLLICSDGLVTSSTTRPSPPCWRPGTRRSARPSSSWPPPWRAEGMTTPPPSSSTPSRCRIFRRRRTRPAPVARAVRGRSDDLPGSLPLPATRAGSAARGADAPVGWCSAGRRC